MFLTRNLQPGCNSAQWILMSYLSLALPLSTLADSEASLYACSIHFLQLSAYSWWDEDWSLGLRLNIISIGSLGWHQKASSKEQILSPCFMFSYMCERLVQGSSSNPSFFCQSGSATLTTASCWTSPLPLWMIRCRSGSFNTTVLLELCKQLIVKLLPLVMMQSCGETKPHLDV